MNRILIFSSLFISAVTWASSAYGQANYVSTEIANDAFEEVYYEDMDGDALLDIIIPMWSQESGRELHIFLQQPNGQFPSRPSRRVELKSEIIAYAFADIRPEPGSELILITASSVFSLSSATPSYSGNLAPLFDWPFVASAPDRRRAHHFAGVADFNNDGFVDLLLPGRNLYGYFKGAPNGQFTLAHSFNPVNQSLDLTQTPLGVGRVSTDFSINEKEGLVFKVKLLNRSGFEGFLSPWNENSDSALLDVQFWQPAAILGLMNNDDRQDIVYMNIGNDLYGQINVLTQDEEGNFSDTPSWQGPIDTKGEIRLIDFNGDGQKDIIRMVNNSNEWDVHFYANRNGQFSLLKADQVMRFSGYDLTVSTSRLRKDSKTLLTVNYYTIPIVNAIRNASVVRTHLMYAQSELPTQVFNSRPDFKLEESFSANEIRGLSSLMRIEADINGDGVRDALYIDDAGALAAKSINDSLQMSTELLWKHVPTRSIIRFETVELNGDNKPDFILHHSNSISLLVSS